MSPPPIPFAFSLDPRTGVPVYRQIIDQVLGGIASGTLQPGDQLPTVRQLAVDLAINPNTVIRSYRELELRGALSTQQGIGTFIAHQAPPPIWPGGRRTSTVSWPTSWPGRGPQASPPARSTPAWATPSSPDPSHSWPIASLRSLPCP